MMIQRVQIAMIFGFLVVACGYMPKQTLVFEVADGSRTYQILAKQDYDDSRVTLFARVRSMDGAVLGLERTIGSLESFAEASSLGYRSVGYGSLSTIVVGGGVRKPLVVWDSVSGFCAPAGHGDADYTTRKLAALSTIATAIGAGEGVCLGYAQGSGIECDL